MQNNNGIYQAIAPLNGPYLDSPMSKLEKLLYYTNFIFILLIWVLFIFGLAKLPSDIAITIQTVYAQTVASKPKIILIIFPLLATISTVLLLYLAKYSHRFALIRARMSIEQGQQVFIIQKTLLRYLSTILNMLVLGILINILTYNIDGSVNEENTSMIFIVFLLLFTLGFGIAVYRIKKVLTL